MNERIRLLAIEAHELCAKRTYGSVHSEEEYREKFAELIERACASECGSQTDRRRILEQFGLAVASTIQYASLEPTGSTESQYQRPYNLAK